MVDSEALAVFAALAADETLRASVRELAHALAGEYKPTVSKELKRAKELAYALYHDGHHDEVLRVTALLRREAFEENFDLWTPIESALALEAHVLRKRGANESVAAEKLLAVLMRNQHDEQAHRRTMKIHARVMDGSLLNDEKIRRAQEDGDKRSELERRDVQLAKLLYMRAMGGSESKPLAWLDAEIADNEEAIARLRENV